MAFNVTVKTLLGEQSGITNTNELKDIISMNDSTSNPYAHDIKIIGVVDGSINGIFSNCTNLTSIDLSNLDTSSVIGMTGMFNGCSSLTSIDLTNLNTSNVTNMDLMFKSCSSLTNLDLSNFDTSNILIMNHMFNGCSNLEHIYVGDSWNTSSAIVSDNMFTACTKLPNFDSTKTDKTMAYIGGYLEKIPEYIIQLKHNEYKAYPKVAVDGTTIVDNNGILSATAQSPSIATTTTAGIVKPDGTSITINENGVISSVGGSDITLVVKGVM